MIVVKVELWSAITGERSEIARMTIDNTGGDMTHGDYRVRTFRGRSEKALHNAMVKNTTQREGKVLQHPRLREHVWNLVAKALNNTGYGKTKGTK